MKQYKIPLLNKNLFNRNLFFLFGVILVALQLLYVDLSRARMEFKASWGLEPYYEQLQGVDFDVTEYSLFINSCKASLKTLYAVGVQIIVLVLIKNYSNRLKRLEDQVLVYERAKRAIKAYTQENASLKSGGSADTPDATPPEDK